MKACTHLSQNKEKVMSRWEKISVAKLPEAQNLSRAAIRDHLPQVLNVLCGVLETGTLKIPAEISKIHGRERSWSTDYSLAEVMAEYSILKNVVYDELTEANDLAFVEARLIDRFFDATSSIAVTEFVALRERELNTATDTLISINADLETFAAVAAHDLRSPASTILGFADMISEENDSMGELTVKSVSVIRKTAGRMLELIDQLLEYSKIGKEHLTRTSFSLSEIANDAKVNLSSQVQDLNAQIQIDEMPDYNGDPVLFRQLFQNLLSNSLKFMAKDRPCVIKVSALTLDHEICISIVDNGVGFDPKLADFIFEPFKRGNNRADIKGSGLGLATAKKIVELHGGKISAVGHLDKGAEFTIRLGVNS